jgi:hypothetical protein
VKGWQAGTAFWSREVRTFSVAKAAPAKPAVMPVPPPSDRRYLRFAVMEGVAILVLLVLLGAALAVKRRFPVTPPAPVRVPEPIPTDESPAPPGLEALRAECEALRQQLAGSAEQAAADQKRAHFHTLANLLVQLPSLRRAAEGGADIRVRDVLPLFAPLDAAVREMGAESIGTVGEDVPYDPRLHQPAGEKAPPPPGERVRVKFVGYRMGEEILRRAQVE